MDKSYPFVFFIMFTIVKNVFLLWAFSSSSETSELSFQLAFKSFQSDLLISIPVLFFTWASKKTSSNVSNILLWALVLLTALIMFIDLQTLLTFNRKLILTDLLKFQNGGIEKTFFITYFLTGTFIFMVSLSLIDFYRKITSRRNNLIMLLLLLAVVLIPIKTEYFKSEYLTQNFIQNNLNMSYSNGFSNKKDLNDRFLESYEIKKGQDKQPNIIMVFAESWSAIDSDKTSGLNIGNLKAFDELTKEGKMFTNFFAEGSTTDQAYVTIFTGLPALLYNNNNDSYKPFFNFKSNNESFIQFLNSKKYKTSFIKAHSLDFLGLRSFLNNLKFNEMIGREEAFYTQKTYSMNGVADDTLYEFIEDGLENRDKPYFLSITSLSTHIPFICPDGSGEKVSYTYSAEAFGRFYKKLKDSGYLKDNYLIVFGDHRKMTSLNDGEYGLYGESAYARISCAVWGSDTTPNTVDNNYYSQTDIVNSIKQLISKQVKLPKNYNNIFTGKINRHYVIHDSFESRSKIMVFNDNNTSSEIKLDGDDTRVISGASAKEALDYINDIRGHYQYMSH